MIFVSSTVPLNQIPTSKEEICKSDWFLFSTTIKTKDYQKDNTLNGIYYQLCIYPYFYTQNLYNYLISDHYYYYTSQLYNIMQNYLQFSWFSCMRKVKHFDEITNWDEEVINEVDHVFKEDDIRKMFESFRENNFRENPVYEYVLGNEM